MTPGGGTDPFVERVREATDIVEIIGAHVALKPAGSRLLRPLLHAAVKAYARRMKRA